MAQLNIRKRGTKWEYRFEIAKVGGKRKQISKGGFDRKTDCLKAGTEAINKYNNTGKVFTPSEISLSDFCVYFIENYAKKTLRHRTIVSYTSVVKNHIKPNLGHLKLSKITPRHINDFLLFLKGQGYKKNTIHKIKTNLSTIFSYAVFPMEYIQTNPCTLVKMPKIEDKKTKKETITYDELLEVEKLLWKNPSLQLAVEVGYFTGMRIGEVFGLTWDCIDFEKGEISVEKQIKKIDNELKITKLKNNVSERIIKIDKMLIQKLKNHKKWQKENQLEYREFYTDYIYIDNYTIIPIKRSKIANKNKICDVVFRRENGDIFLSTFFSAKLGNLSKKLGFDFHFHMLRHTHTVFLLENIGERGIKAIQKRLGHSNITTTMNIYMHSTKKMEDELVDIIDKKRAGG